MLPAATDTNAASSPYSTAVAPLSSLMNLRMSSITARYSSHLASRGEESMRAFNGRYRNIVDGRRRPADACLDRWNIRDFPQSSHESKPVRLAAERIP